jgi:hypothetical protein
MKKKIIISALALTIGAGLAGSITGTAAWYQYSTRTNVALIGASGGAAGNLNVRIKRAGQAAEDGWTTFISKKELGDFLESEGYGTNIQPITPAISDAGLGKDDALPVNSGDSQLDFRSNPIPGKGPYDQWNRAKKENYVVIPLQLRYVKQGNNGQENLSQGVYLSDVTLEQRTVGGATNDISKALRFHVSANNGSTTVNHLISKDGGETITKGKLDLDGDGANDVARSPSKYGFSDVDSSTAPEAIDYGAGKQTAYTSDPNGASTMVAKSREGLNGDDLVDSSIEGKLLGSTVAGSASFLEVNITIWVEGWQTFTNTSGESSIWSTKFIGSDFNIGFEFATNAEVDA